MLLLLAPDLNVFEAGSRVAQAQVGSELLSASTSQMMRL